MGALAAERQARFGVLAPAAPYIEGAWGAARAGEDALVGVVRAAFSCAGQALALALSVCRAGARFVGDAVTFAWGLAQAAAGVVIAALGFLADQALQVLAAAAAARRSLYSAKCLSFPGSSWPPGRVHSRLE